MTSLKKKSASAFVWDLGGTFLKQGSSFIISIFLARLLEPSEFGLVGMAMVFISINHVFIDVGFTSALVQNKINTNLTYSSIFYLNLVAGFMLTIISYWAAPLVGNFFGDESITILVRWLSLMFIFNSLNLVQQTILQKNLNFKILAFRTVFASVVGGAAGVIFAFYGFGVYSLVVQQLTTSFLGTVLLWSVSEWRPDFKFSFNDVKKLTGFSTFVFFDRFISTIFQRLDIVLVGKLYSAATLGFYTRAVTLNDQVTKYSSSSLTKVFFPVLSGLQDNELEYARIYFKVISVISFLSYGLTGILYVIGSDIIIGLFGYKWEPSVHIFQILVISVCNYPLSAMMVSAFMSKGKSKENFQVGMIRKFVRTVPLIIGYFYGIYVFTIAVVFVSYFLTIVNIYFLNRYTGLSIRRHFHKILEGIIPLIMLIIVFLSFDFSTLLDRFLLTVSYAFVYLVYNYTVRTEGFIFILKNGLKLIRKYN